MKFVKGNKDKDIIQRMKELSGESFQFDSYHYYVYHPETIKFSYYRHTEPQGEEITIDEWKELIGMKVPEKIINSYEIF